MDINLIEIIYLIFNPICLKLIIHINIIFGFYSKTKK